MNSQALKTHGDHVNQFARSVPNLGQLGELTRAIVEMLRSKDWRDYRDATGAYHFQPGEFDYFLKIRAADMPDFNRIHGTDLLGLPGVRQTRTFFVMKEVVDNAPLEF